MQTTLGEAITRQAKRDPFARAGQAYIRSLRNAEKRAYAEHVLAYLLGLIGSEVPDRTMYGLSSMGCQAVELRLAQLRKSCDLGLID